MTAEFVEDVDEKDEPESSITPPLAKQTTIFVTRQIRHFDDYYSRDGSIGEPGQFGTCWKCFEKTDTQRQMPFAVKEMRKTKFNLLAPKQRNEILSAFQNEISVLLDVKHPNIVKLYDVFESRDTLHLVLEYLSGGELLERIIQKQAFAEKDAAHILKQILEGLNACHTRNILHLDLKPENIIFKDETDDSLKLIDFGMARVVPRLTKLRGKVGTIQYMAPEVIGADAYYSFGADVWSVGVILFSMLFGFTPFNSKLENIDMAEKDIGEKILNGFEAEVKPGWGAWFPDQVVISPECQKLLTKMLEYDVKKRWTVRECLSSSWIQNYENNEHLISPIVRDSLLKFQTASHFKRAISDLFAQHLDIDHRKEIQDFFQEMDTNNDGQLSLAEFRAGLHKVCSDLPESKIDQIFSSIDADNDFSISFEELLATSAIRSISSVDDRLLEAFEELDANKDGHIDKQEMENAAQVVCKNNSGMKPAEIQLVLHRLKSAFKEADSNNDGVVDYHEFLEALHPQYKENYSFEKFIETPQALAHRGAAFSVGTTNSERGVVVQPQGATHKHRHGHGHTGKRASVELHSESKMEEADPNSKSKSDLLADNLKLQTEMNEMRKQNAKLEKIYRNSVDKAYRLQEENVAKDTKIKNLELQLAEKDAELDQLQQAVNAK